MRVRRFASFLALIAAAACASGGGGGDGAPRGSSTLIIQEEIEPLGNLTAYQVIQRLRPQWLRPRAGSDNPVVFLDGSRLGDPDRLNSIQAATVAQMRFRDGRDATTRYGTGFGGGAIEVTSRGR